MTENSSKNLSVNVSARLAYLKVLVDNGKIAKSDYDRVKNECQTSPGEAWNILKPLFKVVVDHTDRIRDTLYTQFYNEQSIKRSEILSEPNLEFNMLENHIAILRSENSKLTNNVYALEQNIKAGQNAISTYKNFKTEYKEYKDLIYDTKVADFFNLGIGVAYNSDYKITRVDHIKALYKDIENKGYVPQKVVDAINFCNLYSIGKVATKIYEQWDDKKIPKVEDYLINYVNEKYLKVFYALIGIFAGKNVDIKNTTFADFNMADFKNSISGNTKNLYDEFETKNSIYILKDDNPIIHSDFVHKIVLNPDLKCGKIELTLKETKVSTMPVPKALKNTKGGLKIFNYEHKGDVPVGKQFQIGTNTFDIIEKKIAYNKELDELLDFTVKHLLDKTGTYLCIDGTKFLTFGGYIDFNKFVKDKPSLATLRKNINAKPEEKGQINKLADIGRHYADIITSFDNFKKSLKSYKQEIKKGIFEERSIQINNIIFAQKWQYFTSTNSDDNIDLVGFLKYIKDGGSMDHENRHAINAFKIILDKI